MKRNGSNPEALARISIHITKPSFTYYVSAVNVSATLIIPYVNVVITTWNMLQKIKFDLFTESILYSEISESRNGNNCHCQGVVNRGLIDHKHFASTINIRRCSEDHVRC